MDHQEITPEVVGAEKKVKKELSRLSLLLLAGSLIIFAVQRLVDMVVEIFCPGWLEDPTAILLLSVVPMYLVGVPLLILLVKTLPGEAPPRHSMKTGHFFMAVVMSFAVMYLSNFVGVGITEVIGLLKGEPVQNPVAELAAGADMGVTFLCMVICAPMIEEYIFRKLVIDRTRRFGEGTAIVISGVLFGLFHGNLSQFFYATALGMCFAFIYVKTGQLKLVVFLHMIINFMGAVISVWVLKILRYEELLEISAGGNQQEMIVHMLENPVGWLVYMAYLGLVILLMIAGGIMILLFRKRFALKKGTVRVPKGKGFSTVFLNPGTVLYSLFWLVIMAVNLR